LDRIGGGVHVGADAVNRLESWAGVDGVAGVASETRSHLSSPSGLRLAKQLADHLSAYNATDDLVPYFGDYRLAHTEAFYQLKNSVCLAYHGFYSQAFATLRSVCELSLLQATLPEGDAVSDRTFDLLRSALPPGQVLPDRDDVNWLLPVGFGATQTPGREATTLAEWAVDGCRTPKWQSMRDCLLDSDAARDYDSATQLSARLGESLSSLDPYVHARGHLRSATGLSAGNTLQFSAESLSQYGTRMMCATQVSIAVLLVAFLPSATSCPEAAAGFIDGGDLHLALSVLPSKDAGLLRAIYDRRDA
jgi:hypothetical protein